ncbi:MAG: sorbosone dehydrogenase family protein [Planctomycetota bacterium]
MVRTHFAVATVLLGLALARNAASQTLQQTVLATQLDSPVAMALAPDGRVFVAQQGGAVRVIEDDVLLPQPFVVVPTIANDEEGLVGIALDPQFAQNGFVYLRVTTQTPTRHNQIVRYTASGDVAVAGSELVLFDLDTNQAHFHLGGSLRFAPDGTLFFATGDNDTPFFAGNLGSLHGKMLRIRSDGTIPTDNPYFGTLSGRLRAIWAHGFRNTFSFAIHPQTGRVFANDVGSSQWEEINDVVAGGNYGWPGNEGPGGAAGTTDPLYAYDHQSLGGGCAVTGGAFYAPTTPQLGAQYPGQYLFCEYCRAEIRALDPAAPTGHTRVVTCDVRGPVDLAVAADGALYYLARGNGAGSGGTGIRFGALVKVTAPGAFLPTFTTFGDGCVGTAGVPALAANGAPRLATPGFQVLLANVLPSTLVALQLGLSNTAWALGPLPQDLGVVGMPGCLLRTSGDLTLALFHGAGSTATIPLGIPNDASMLGIPVHMQGFAVDFAANPFGGVVSGGATLRVGT